MRDGLERPRLVVDVKGIPGLRDVAFDAREGLTVGAAVNMNRLVSDAYVQRHYSLLAEAANSVASYQVRNRATVGGNLCNASPAADMAPALLCLDAQLVLCGQTGLRSVRVRDFFLGPGRTALTAGELVLEVRCPAPRPAGCGRYIKLGRNKAGDLAIVGVAVYGWPDEARAGGLRFQIGLASVAPTPMRAVAAEEVLTQNPPTAHWLKAAAEAAAESASPIDDVRASAAYRKEMVRNLVLRGLTDVTARLMQREGGQGAGTYPGEA
jgi:CO/xanthine dehydrogenase FAD-binding subunit